ncbi:hypothetical protein [Dictyobacter kobayashii]|uniref:Uncharacterized protein n=1 Tax=Dictyobacter kobayashii TaxID=2014872 RepID=A0A402AQU2_9CHLR|nr:hypothetical protein [Dictyobacter kobayashii]GCE21469.1 hypothetical protein KDK_52690 [Dictyobacter kobayashii]
MANKFMSQQGSNPWAFNRLALVLTIVLIVVIALFCIWYFGKHPGSSQPGPGEINPGPKHTRLVVPQQSALATPDRSGDFIISLN